MSKNVYSFGGGTADGDGKMKDVLGGKGAGPGGDVARRAARAPRLHHRHRRLQHLFREQQTGARRRPDRKSTRRSRSSKRRWARSWAMPQNPLLLSVRSGAKFSMPGMMNTILNLGLNDDDHRRPRRTRAAIARFAYDCYRRFIQMFGEVALDIDMEKFDHIFDARKAKIKAKLDTDLTADDLKAIIADYKKLVQKETRKPFPQDPREQLSLSRDAVFGSWWNPKAAYYRKMEKIPDDIGTAANVQAMVFGNMGDTSGTGVGFTRDPGTGEKVFYGEFLMNAQGEDVVAGIRTPQPISDLEADHARSLRAASRNHHQPRKALQGHAGFRVHHSGRQALHAADPQWQAHRSGGRAHRRRHGGRGHDHEEGSGPARRARAARSVAASGVRSEDARKTSSSSPPASRLRPAPPSDAWRSPPKTPSKWPPSGPVLLVRKETTPDDIHGMDVAKGILTAIGGKSSHAAVVARGMGRPCVVGAGEIRIDEAKKIFTVAGRRQNHHRERRRFHLARRHHRRRLSRPGENRRTRSQPRLHRQVHELDR